MGVNLPIGVVEQTFTPSPIPVWVVYGNSPTCFLRRGNILPPTVYFFNTVSPFDQPNGYNLVWTTTPVNLGTLTTITAICSCPDNINVCYVAITVGTTIKVLRVDTLSGTTNTLFTTTLNTGYISQIVCLNSGKVLFAVTSTTAQSSPMGVYQSNDGSTTQYLGTGNNSATFFGVWGVAYSTTLGAIKGTPRIYTLHDAGATAACVSYTDDNGSTWHDIAGSYDGLIAKYSPGNISTVPQNDGSTDIFYVIQYGNASLGVFSLQRSFIENGVPTNVRFDWLGNDVTPGTAPWGMVTFTNYVGRNMIWNSTTSQCIVTNKLNLQQGTIFYNNFTVANADAPAGWSVLPALDLAVFAAPSGNIALTNSYGTFWAVLPVPDVAQAVSLWGGTSWYANS